MRKNIYRELKYEELKKLILEENINILLAGKRGSGKTWTCSKLKNELENIKVYDFGESEGLIISDNILVQNKPFIATINADITVEAIENFSIKYQISINDAIEMFDYVALIEERNRTHVYIITPISEIKKLLYI